MTEIINLSEHRNKSNKDLSVEADDEQIKIFSERSLLHTQKWILDTKPKNPNDNIVSFANIFMSKDGSFQANFDAVDDKHKILLIGGLDILKSTIINNIQYAQEDGDD